MNSSSTKIIEIVFMAIPVIIPYGYYEINSMNEVKIIFKMPNPAYVQPKSW